MARRRGSDDGELAALVMLLGGAVVVAAFRWWWRRVACPIFRFHRRMVRPTHRHLAPDLLVERLAVVRSLVGMALLVTVEVVWRDVDLAAAGDVAADSLGAAYQNALWLIGLFVVVSLGLVAVARRGHRRALLTSLGAPAAGVGTVAGTFALLFGAERLMSLGGASGAGEEPSALWVLLVIVGYLAITTVLLPWMVVTVFYTVPQLVAHYCRAVDGHPAMRALLALGLAVVLVAVATARWAAGGGSDLPLVVRLCVSYGGPVLVSGLAVWELARLRARGVTVRTPVAV